MEHLSNIELYYTPSGFIRGDELILTEDEFHHSVNVMRNSVGDLLYVTDGEGIIFKTEITSICKKQLSALILEKKEFINKAANLWFCIPALKNSDRLKYAFEKCVELGITNFILFSSKRTISRKVKLEKFQKTTLAAMKQSLRAFLPQIVSSIFGDIITFDGSKILFDQNVKAIFDGNQNISQPTYFLFGPEGGFDENEIELVREQNRFSLSSNRLRSETAIIKVASLLKLH
ncbi:MAG: 16S rRNA (uracil(1498)-N(3))-methyltransferase [Ignavibacteriaceae bacterium]|nr:16S rRNA (uracil(1498)-N(3))-methyltransferase [Ignavibacteriaceae bacterium]